MNVQPQTAWRRLPTCRWPAMRSMVERVKRSVAYSRLPATSSGVSSSSNTRSICAALASAWPRHSPARSTAWETLVSAGSRLAVVHGHCRPPLRRFVSRRRSARPAPHAWQPDTAGGHTLCVVSPHQRCQSLGAMSQGGGRTGIGSVRRPVMLPRSLPAAASSGPSVCSDSIFWNRGVYDALRGASTASTMRANGTSALAMAPCTAALTRSRCCLKLGEPARVARRQRRACMQRGLCRVEVAATYLVEAEAFVSYGSARHRCQQPQLLS